MQGGSAIKLRPTESSNRKKQFIQQKPKLVLYDKNKEKYINRPSGLEDAALYLLYFIIPGIIGYLSGKSYNLLTIYMTQIVVMFISYLIIDEFGTRKFQWGLW